MDNHYVIGPRALNDYTANLPESSKKKQKEPWWEKEKKAVCSVVVASPMDKKPKAENF
jgi:hypothetical protein